MKNIILIISLILPLWCFPQKKISLQEAWEKALENNLQLKNGKMQLKFQQQLENSYKTVDPLSISAEIGQFSTDKTDNQISVSQQFRLPKFYQTQKKVLLAQTQNAGFNLELQKKTLKKEIALVYNNLNYMDEKEKILRKADSIYTQYFERATLRLKKGEANILEQTTAETYRSEAAIQLKSLYADRQQALFTFNMLINGPEKYRNASDRFFEDNTSGFEKDYQGNKTLLKPLEQQKEIENLKTEAEKARLLPTFNLGIASRTLQGMDLERPQKRFQSALIGIDIPIFNTAQKSVIESQKISEEIAENNYQLGLQNLKKEYQLVYLEYHKLKTEQEYYKTLGLKNADTILQTANRLFAEGEINFLEWALLVNQSLEIENKYTDNQKKLNDKIIELNTLTDEN